MTEEITFPTQGKRERGNRTILKFLLERKFNVGCLVFLALLGGFILYRLEFGWTSNKVERMIKAALPPGSTRQEVEAWLGKQKIEYVYLKDVTGDRTNDKTMPQIAGLKHEELSGMIRATIPDAHVHLILPGDMHIYFFFDLDGKLIKHLVRPFVYLL
jgi:hypothetical protein